MNKREAEQLAADITRATGSTAQVTKDGRDYAVLDTSTNLTYHSRLFWIAARAGEIRALATLTRAFSEDITNE